jgi:predicted NAD/FAD-binding protein
MPYGQLAGNGPLDIAVIGSGISGLSCAWLLSKGHKVTLYEGADRLGGHTNTVTPASVPGLAVDAGFIVYTEATYPNFTALLKHLGVASQPSEMSFAVSRRDGGLEYAGTDLAGLFAQKANLLRPRFWGMLKDLLRFYRQAPRDAQAMEAGHLSLNAYLKAGGYGAALSEDHLLPMAAAIWSTPTASVGDYPAAAFIRFCENHGLLRVSGRPAWRTVTGGARHYLDRMLQDISGPVHIARQILSVTRDADGVRLRDVSGQIARHDQVVMAGAAHHSLAMLGEEATAEETSLLGAFGHTRNLAVLHTDASLMPRRRRVWSSWNFMEHDATKGGSAPFVTYWMNRLQGIPGPQEYFLTLNPPRPPAAGTLLHSEQYSHPLFDRAALAAQRRLWSLQGVNRTWFCGAWFGAGFHEDGLQSGLAVAEALGGLRRPWQCAEESGRIHLAERPIPVVVP